MRLSLQDTRSLEIHEAAISSGRFTPTFVRFLNHVADSVDKICLEQVTLTANGISEVNLTVSGIYFLNLEESYGYELTRDADGWFVSYIERSDVRMSYASRKITHLIATIDTGGRLIDFVAELHQDEPLPGDYVDPDRIALSPSLLMPTDRLIHLREAACPAPVVVAVPAPVRLTLLQRIRAFFQEAGGVIAIMSR